MYSRALEAAVRAAKGRDVEAPVSGSRQRAEARPLVAMLAGEATAVKEVRPPLEPLCHHRVRCGAVSQALRMKLTVNLFLIVTAPAKPGFLEVLGAALLASAVSRVKAQVQPPPLRLGRFMTVHATSLAGGR
ncbi:3-hydroxyisobutyrate dehydrogenase-like beta-hydroxyacid dehydrogenase [Deinobacterium chartae]|uniref:3-hydroxyisobutyrate dehydrogenase-like beta-hydroxyacid dehydrogenase n=1 Tax=Deinobacterium chartae TaxID=521158 RepID=A0A841I627_9DEIO|nr:NAD(P)-binding domain-containing protein [Deinobacterium chartae]MBB6099719.1 3-hydroxyisobutyrate dehydrogenase-like beta-hydroxyacid dehydrogenase [Deinobacterium chartae]